MEVRNLAIKVVGGLSKPLKLLDGVTKFFGMDGRDTPFLNFWKKKITIHKWQHQYLSNRSGQKLFV